MEKFIAIEIIGLITLWKFINKEWNMAQYEITITVDEGQDKILKAEATARNKTPVELLEYLSVSITAQINAWIQGQINAKLGTITPADALARLSYFDTK